MKTIRKYIEHFVLLFTIIIFQQSCVVYQKNSVSLETAESQGLKAKVEMKTQESYKFQRIVFENNHYYGIQKTNGETIKKPLEVNELNKIRLQDKSTSTIATVATILGSLIGVILIWYFIDTGGGDWLNLSE